jgi:hypothetical protein
VSLRTPSKADWCGFKDISLYPLLAKKDREKKGEKEKHNYERCK